MGDMLSLSDLKRAATILNSQKYSLKKPKLNSNIYDALERHFKKSGISMEGIERIEVDRLEGQG
jgi:hypothetical protein